MSATARSITPAVCRILSQYVGRKNFSVPFRDGGSDSKAEQNGNEQKQSEPNKMSMNKKLNAVKETVNKICLRVAKNDKCKCAVAGKPPAWGYFIR